MGLAKRTPTKPSPLTARVIAVALAILCAPGLFQGCSGCTCEHCFAQGVAEGVRRDAAKDYVHTAPIADTERVTRAYATGAGFLVPEGAFTKTTHVVAKSSNGSEIEMKLDFSPVGKDRYRLEVSHVSTFTATDGGTSKSTTRDLDTEWEIASRVDPAFAAKTNEKAADRRERAESVGRGCDRGCELGCRACETCDRVIR